MAKNKHNDLPDGYLSFAGGVDSGQHPRLISNDQGGWAINCSHRGGVLGPRLGLEKRKLNFSNSQEKLDFEIGGWFQGAGIHKQATGQEDLLCMIAGRLWYIDTQTFEVTNVTPGETNDDIDWPEADLTIFTQAEDNTIISNGKDAPIIYGNNGSRRADASSNEVPSGLPTAYGNGRVWVAKEREYLAGDLVGSSSGTPASSFRDAVLKFTENTFINEGGSFATQGGFIRGLSFMPNLDTTLGEGDLIIFTTEKTYATNVPSDRTQWRDLDYPIQRTILDKGGENHRGITSVNGDLYFRAQDGIRSLLFARRDYQTPGNTPISTEVGRLTNHETSYLLKYGSGVFFEDRFLHTVTPRVTYSGNNTRMGVTWDGLAVLDFNPINSNRSKQQSAWDGQWVTLPTFQILRGAQRCWLFVFEADAVQLWEMIPNRQYDKSLTDPYTEINWAWESKALDFGDSTSLKRLDSIEVWLQDVRDEVTIYVDYKSDESNQWVNWGEWKEKVKIQNPGILSGGVMQPSMYLPGYRPRRTLGPPTGSCETNVQPFKPPYVGHEFQIRFRVKGDVSISRVKVNAAAEQEDIYPECPPTVAIETSNSSSGTVVDGSLTGPPGVGEIIVGDYILGA